MASDHPLDVSPQASIPSADSGGNVTEVSGPGGGPIPVQVEHTTPSIRLLLQQALGAEPQVVDVAAERSDPFPKDLGGRPRLD
jgi:hypothetical protein